MKKAMIFWMLVPFLAQSQVILTAWKFNQNGDLASYWAQTGTAMSPAWTWTNTTDSADVLKICYTADQVYVRSEGMTDYMGKYLNPGTCKAQHYVHRIPRNPKEATTKSISPKIGAIGLLTNGIPIFGLGDAKSWNGSTNVMMGPGIWNMEVGKGEGFTLDTAFAAHPQQQGAYHSHTAPYRLFKNSPPTVHSPLVGFAFDGYPVYGPYGFSEPMNASSAVARMKSGYSLRNITTRTTLPYGVAASQTGPPVNATYPIGTYCEDYEWLAANGGDLDKYNGRFCVTPEFPAGTYAYFTTIDAAGKAVFPYYIGIEYYGEPDKANFPNGPNGNGLTVPNTVTNCLTKTLSAATDLAEKKEFVVFPNPTDGQVFVRLGSGFDRLILLNNVGQLVFEKTFSSLETTTVFEISEKTGLYFLKCQNSRTGDFSVKKLVVE